MKLLDILLESLNLIENSKNDPIPEISKYNKGLCIFLIGPPAAGKSTFVSNQILRWNRNFTVVNPDEIQKVMTKNDFSQPRPSGISRLSMKKAESIMKSGQNLIYDTTGNDYSRISHLNTIAKKSNYIVIFIHVLDSLSDIMHRAKKRKRPTDPDYIQTSYSKTQNLIHKFYTEFNPDSYYIITTLSNRYKYYKYDGNKISKKKTDKYV